jgi:hypothetical protein
MAEHAERRRGPPPHNDRAHRERGQRHLLLERRSAALPMAGYGALLGSRPPGSQPVQRAAPPGGALFQDRTPVRRVIGLQAGVAQRVKGIVKGTSVKAMYEGDTPATGTVEEDLGNKYKIRLETYDGEAVASLSLDEIGLPEDGIVEIPEQWVNPLQAIRSAPEQGVTISHFAPAERGVTPAEFVDRDKRRIDVTSHGMGTGIYGLSHASPERRQQALENNPTTEVTEIQIARPFMIQDGGHGGQYTSLSKGLQRLVAAMVAATESTTPGVLISARLWKKYDTENLLATFKSVMRAVGREGEATEALIEQTVKLSLGNYYMGKDPLSVQPINHLMKQLGHDGVYATNPSDDRWSRGSVKFADDASHAKEHGQRIHM